MENIDKEILENINKEILENIDKEISENKIMNRLEFGISNRASANGNFGQEPTAKFLYWRSFLMLLITTGAEK